MLVIELLIFFLTCSALHLYALNFPDFFYRDCCHVTDLFRYVLICLFSGVPSKPIADFRIASILEPSKEVKCPFCAIPFVETNLLRFHLMFGFCSHKA